MRSDGIFALASACWCGDEAPSFIEATIAFWFCYLVRPSMQPRTNATDKLVRLETRETEWFFRHSVRPHSAPHSLADRS
jgi:hypothetical protein